MTSEPRRPRFLQRAAADAQAARDEIVAGLVQVPATVSPKHFYDRLGSQLVAALTELPEYYPTRVEAGILETHGAALAQAVGSGATWIDLGAGDCAKAMRLMPRLQPARYVAVDISVEFLREALLAVQRLHPALDVLGVGTDFSAALDLPAEATAGRPVFFYPGSSIGNFTPPQALDFLRRVHARAAGGGLVIGVDLVKPTPILEAAYDDALGVTAAFNLNLLRHLNRLVGSDFEPRQWRHVGRYDTALSRIEMHLEAREALVVRWPGGARRFAAGERMHTENSYKYEADDFAALLRDAGFASPRRWSDAQGWFAVYWAEA
jgi:dimethylhistidine N-methyltransferase